MPLSVGDKLGPYEILAPIGAGGMGEVYRAKDTKLKRDVALKVLPGSFANDPERMARFQREAEVLASLNHPNIAAIYGVEDRALVIELVEGETLKGPLPVETVLHYAKQITEALEAAHEKGIIHRDLKPANVKVTPEGVVKVLDFGLAKAADESTGSADSAKSPTLTMSPTRAGMILGTAAYMSPEQAHSKTADRRADIWSFGTVVYEMLTGEQAFQGESVSDILASVLKLEPAWDRLPSNTPGTIRKLLHRCLTKDRKQRLQAIGEARIAIDEALEGTASDEAVAPMAATRRTVLGWALVALTSVMLGLALWGWLRPTPARARGVVRFTAAVSLANALGWIALAPDGSLLAFVGGPRQQIYVRALDQFEARPISGTEGASFLCISPDGQWISYMSGRNPRFQLKKIAVAGGPTQTLADIVAITGPPTQNWGADDNILFANDGVLMRIPSGGGKPETLATPDRKQGEQYYAGPQLLPGGREVLVSIATAGAGVNGHRIGTLNLQTREKKTLLERAGVGQYVPTGQSGETGHIVYYDAGTGSLMAVPFNVSRREVKGAPVPVLAGVQDIRGPFGAFGFSASGTLAYVPGSTDRGAGSTLIWVDRDGNEQPLPVPPRLYTSLRLSPDGKRAALAISDDTTPDIWLYDLERSTLGRITSEGNIGSLLWTPDGKRLIYERSPAAGAAVLWVPADGSSPPSILATREKTPITPSSVTPDGKLLLGNYPLDKELWVMPLPEGATGATKPKVFLDSKYRKFNAAFSSDGKWVAYRSDDTGRDEIYVVPYPGPGGKFQISTDGAEMPRWARNGRELFYRNGDKMMVVDVQTSSGFRAGKPRMLFEGRYGRNYDVDPDGKRFLMIKPVAVHEGQGGQVNMVLNWFEELRRRVPVRN